MYSRPIEHPNANCSATISLAHANLGEQHAFEYTGRNHWTRACRKCCSNCQLMSARQQIRANNMFTANIFR